MAKADFCFTYYDGDAARDMAHMNRLERGAYSDIIISQRKFGHLTLDQIKKILGKDFAECWPAIELVMKQAEGKFFIEWLQTSESKARTHSKYQSDKRKGKTKKNQTVTGPEPNKTHTQPLGDGDGSGDGIEEKLNSALHENFIKPLRLKYKFIDFSREMEFFRDKVRGSPEDYAEHDIPGLRKAFNYQLRNARTTNQKPSSGTSTFAGTGYGDKF